MANNFWACLTAIIVGTVILRLPHLSGGVPSDELDRALSVLRVRGRALFANGIATSDLLFDLLSADSLTLFCPTDSTLFALDMTHSLSFYISKLRLHAVPLRLPVSDLRSLPNASSLPTLLPSQRLLLTKPSSPPDSIHLNGVRLLLPGLFYSQHLAVHGLADLLPLENRTVASPPHDNHMVDAPAESPMFPVSAAPEFAESRLFAESRATATELEDSLFSKSGISA